MDDCLYRRHPNIFQHSRRTHPPCQVRAETSHEVSTLCQSGEVRIPSDQHLIPRIHYQPGGNGNGREEGKVKAVLEWPKPQTVKELQRFLGFANFCRRFIRDFSKIAAPLTAMTKHHSARLSWSSESHQALEELKTQFTSAPILRHPDPEKEFIVEVDASNTGVGAILSQRHGSQAKMYPCVFFSRKLTATEQNYDVGNRELLAM